MASWPTFTFNNLTVTDLDLIQRRLLTKVNADIHRCFNVLVVLGVEGELTGVQILVHLAERHGRAARLGHVYSFTTRVNCTRVSRDLKTLDRDLIIPGDQLLGAQGLRVALVRLVEAGRVPLESDTPVSRLLVYTTCPHPA